MDFKRVLVSILASAMLLNSTTLVFAENNISINGVSDNIIAEEDFSSTISNNDGAISSNSSNSNEESSNLINISDNSISENEQVDSDADTIINDISSLADLNTQLDSLYNEVSSATGLSKEYVKQLHLIAGGKAVYADKKADIYSDETVDTMPGAMELQGASINYIKAPFAECTDSSIERPSKYYLPDVVYSVAYAINNIMNERKECNRGGVQIYYDSLKEDVKTQIDFYEAVLIYLGTPEYKVDNFYTAYEKILYDKNSNENVVEISSTGKAVIKAKFLDAITDIGISDSNVLDKLAIIMEFDGELAKNDSIESLQDDYILPYKKNYTSRENMMVAAACLVGKVRYVWGGGHSGASYIDGINPVWSKWNDLYPKDSISSDGYGKCIKESGSWCPLHGYNAGDDIGTTINSLDEYISLRKDFFGSDQLDSEKYRELLNEVDYTNGISEHTLDGLDCSGFASWLYNQITDKYTVNSTAANFTNQEALQQVEFGNDMLPGDVFAWSTHIVVIVGKVRDGSKAYVTVEETPNVLKYGVVYYSSASKEDVNEATEVAREANELIGGLGSQSGENPHVYCMNNVGHTKSIVKIGNASDGILSIGDSEYTVTDDSASKFSEFEDKVNNDSSLSSNKITVEFSGIDSSNIQDIMNEASVSGDATGELRADINGNIYAVVNSQYYSIGRFKDQFIDETTQIGDYNIPMVDMTAQEIIQNTISKLPISYLTGYNTYTGKRFDKGQASTDMTDTKETVSDENCN